jgi:hypothetical protein
MESKATNILNDIMQKLSAITAEEVNEVENIEVQAEEVTETPEVEEVALSEDSTEVEETTEDKVEVASEDNSTEEVELSEEDTTELEEDSEEVELMEGYVKEEDFNSKIAELEDMIKSIKEDMMVEYDKVEKEKAELSSQLQKLSAEPAAEPIAHAPSEKMENKEVVKFGQNRPANTLDRVFSKLI